MATETLSRATRLDAFGLSHTGNVRPANEDHFAIMTLQKLVQLRATNLQDTTILDRLRRPEATILVVADGVGGAVGGKIASGIAVASVVEYLAEAVGCVQDFDVAAEQAFLDHLSHAVERGHERLKTMIPQGGPATTLTMATIVWPRAYVVHVGDSRGYFLRGDALRQFTQDQTVGAYLVDIGAVTEQHAKKAGLYNVLSSSVGGGDLTPSVGVVDLTEGDALLLCTDGLTKHVSDERIAELLSSHSVEAAAQSLVDAALAGGGSDNVTVVVARAMG